MSRMADKYFLDEDSGIITFDHFTLDGDGTTLDANVNGSVTPQSFEFRPNTARGYVYCINSIGFEMTDAKNWSLTEMGNLGAALSTGINIGIYRDSDDVQLGALTSQENIKTNVDFYQYFPDTRYIDYGSGDSEALLIGRMNLADVIGAPRIVKDGFSMRVLISDNLTGLSKLHFYVSGYYGTAFRGNAVKK